MRRLAARLSETVTSVDLRARVAQAEAVLFVAGEPLSVGEIARALQCANDQAEEALSALQTRLDESGSSLQILSIAGGYQLSTRPAYAEVIGRLLTRETGKLSRAALETLAIIAYRQPITQPEIEAVRGVGCTSVLRTLVERNLIAEAGRKPTVGRPILYATTPSFLHYFALKDLSELPPLEPQEIGSEDAAVTE